VQRECKLGAKQYAISRRKCQILGEKRESLSFEPPSG